MLINEWRLDGSTALVDTNRRMRELAGPATDHYSEFLPISYRGREIMELAILFRHEICCFLSGTFMTFLAGVFGSYRAVTLYIALDYDSPIQNFLFQRGQEPIKLIVFGMCELHLVEALHELDTMTYRIESYDDEHSAQIVILGVDTSQPCGPTSNVDFVYFIWTHFEEFSLKKFCMTTVPSRNDPTEPNMLYRQYYRAESDG
jgi:hypothetical protein